MKGYYRQLTGEAFKTTIDCPERKAMKLYISQDLEEEGNPETKFYSPNGTLIAIGYLRIVYGDHGPYIEFLPKHMVREAWKLHRRKSSKAWYDECVPKDGSSCLLYVQKRTVETLRNPPKTGDYQVRKNRTEGYADYRVGRLYINPLQVRLDL
jgi:hypothetical protein